MPRESRDRLTEKIVGEMGIYLSAHPEEARGLVLWLCRQRATCLTEAKLREWLEKLQARNIEDAEMGGRA